MSSVLTWDITKGQLVSKRYHQLTQDVTIDLLARQDGQKGVLKLKNDTLAPHTVNFSGLKQRGLEVPLVVPAGGMAELRFSVSEGVAWWSYSRFRQLAAPPDTSTWDTSLDGWLASEGLSLVPNGVRLTNQGAGSYSQITIRRSVNFAEMRQYTFRCRVHNFTNDDFDFNIVLGIGTDNGDRVPVAHGSFIDYERTLPVTTTPELLYFVANKGASNFLQPGEYIEYQNFEVI